MGNKLNEKSKLLLQNIIQNMSHCLLFCSPDIHVRKICSLKTAKINVKLKINK